MIRCDFAVLVVDGSEGKSAIDAELESLFKQHAIPYLTVYNKSDISKNRYADGISVSAVTGENIGLPQGIGLVRGFRMMLFTGIVGGQVLFKKMAEGAGRAEGAEGGSLIVDDLDGQFQTGVEGFQKLSQFFFIDKRIQKRFHNGFPSG